MPMSQDEPKTEEQWRDFDELNPETHPEDGARVFVVVESAKQGPATYHTKTGFSLFNAPFEKLGSVKQWRPQEW